MTREQLEKAKDIERNIDLTRYRIEDYNRAMNQVENEKDDKVSIKIMADFTESKNLLVSKQDLLVLLEERRLSLEESLEILNRELVEL